MKNQAFKISYLFYITKTILNLKNQRIIVQYKNTYSLKVTNCGSFECFIKKLIGFEVFIVFKKDCNVCMFYMCACVFVYFVLYKSYGVIVMYNIMC